MSGPVNIFNAGVSATALVQIADFNIDDPATGAHPIDGNPILVSHPAGTALVTQSFNLRDRNVAYDDGSRSTGLLTFTLAELTGGKAGWDFDADVSGFAQNKREYTFADGSVFLFHVLYQDADGGSNIKFVELHNGQWNQTGGYTGFSTTFSAPPVAGAPVAVAGTVNNLLGRWEPPAPVNADGNIITGIDYRAATTIKIAFRLENDEWARVGEVPMVGRYTGYSDGLLVWFQNGHCRVGFVDDDTGTVILDDISTELEILWIEVYKRETFTPQAAATAEFVPLTQAAYDALSPAEQADVTKLYLIAA